MTVSARTLTAISAGVLFASVAANVVLTFPDGVSLFTPFFGVHVAIFFLGVWTVFRIWKLRTSWSEVVVVLRSLPRWLLAVGAVSAAVVAYSAKDVDFNLGTLSDGTPVHSKSWRESNGKYWLSLNKGPAREISSAEYQRLQRKSFTFFATGWVVISYVILVQWCYIYRRESAANAA